MSKDNVTYACGSVAGPRDIIRPNSWLWWVYLHPHTYQFEIVSGVQMNGNLKLFDVHGRYRYVDANNYRLVDRNGGLAEYIADHETPTAGKTQSAD